MTSRTLIRRTTAFLVLALALLAGAVSPTNAATEEPATTTAPDEANEPTEKPAPSRPSFAPT